ncbi:MAG TPA: DUF4160 domain-containing protein [Longimicrobiaceae bacterium]
MPTVLRIGGFAFSFYSADHDPPHVHVRYGGTLCRIDLSTLLMKNISMKTSDAARALRLTVEHHEELLAAWSAHFLKASGQ